MIIQCESCGTKFRLDETRLKQNGSKVRCSRCKAAFVAYPPEQPPVEHIQPESYAQEGFEETVALDSPVAMERERLDAEKGEVDIEKLFGEFPEDQVKVSSKEDEELFGRDERAPIAGASSGRSFLEDLSEEAPEEMAQERPGDSGETLKTLSAPKRAGRSRMAMVVLLIILLALGGAAAVVLYAPGLLPDSLSMLKKARQDVAADTGVRRLSFKAVNGAFVDLEKGGPLFVIRGEVANNYPKSRSFILIRGRILDDKGQPIKKKEAYAGTVFTEEEMKSLSITEIDEVAKDRYGMAKKNFNLTPGGTVPFMIVFSDLPDNLSEFTVEAVSSSPGA